MLLFPHAPTSGIKNTIINLYPAIFSVWKRNQEALLQQVRLEGRGLIIGGDGRADSPGHSAKYGSYTVMELEMGVVLDV